MEQGDRTSSRSSLLDYAVSKLTPDVFSHPVWVRFGRMHGSDSLNTVDDLLSAVGTLQENEPSVASQLLLLCAAYQNYAGQGFNALQTTQKALTLSRNCGLTKETIWALWGLCAISVQQGDHEKACAHLVDLQATLNEQNEWIIASYIDVFRQACSQAIVDQVAKQQHDWSVQPAFDDMLALTFDWLFHWGFSAIQFETEFVATNGNSLNRLLKRSQLTPPFFSFQRWHSFILAMRGELHFRWGKGEFYANTKLSLWGQLVNSVRSYITDQKRSVPQEGSLNQIEALELLPAAKENPPPNTENIKESLDAQNPLANHHSSEENTSIPVAVHMLGTFSMTVRDLTIKLPTSRSLSILKYLLIHRRKHITREMLMDVFWPDSEPETARNSLDVAMHNLRKALRDKFFLPVVLYQDGGYTFEPSLTIWLDVEEFERCVQAGQRLESRNQQKASITEYEAAISLYQGDLLEQNRYEEWTVVERERLRVAYLDTLDRLSHIYFSQGDYGMCTMLCQRILTFDNCSENAHRRLIRCYSRQGQQHLALRQYAVCADAVRRELDVEPEPVTAELYEQIRRGQPI